MSSPQNRSRGVARAALAAVAAVAALAVLPAAASASLVQVTDQKLLRIGGFGEERNQLEMRFRPDSTPANPFGRFIIFDKVGAEPGSPECVSINERTVTCGAAGVDEVSVVLGDLDDELLIDTRGGNLVPPFFKVHARAGDGDDVLLGGRGDDVIKGEQGRDVIGGSAGADMIEGGPGVDALLGFAGDDRLFGGPGIDGIFGQRGADALVGGRGIDILVAKDGKRDRRLSCGPGTVTEQRAVVDRFDPKAHGCTVDD
jgi:hypothetical protein